jgi:TatD DNase family protein
MFVDSHCHLSSPELVDRVPEIRAAMRAAHVEQALCICTTLDEFARVHALALDDDDLWCSVGVHPDEEDSREPTVESLVELAALPKVVAIGETGLDYYRLAGRTVVDMGWQRDRFRVHVRAARASGKPLVVHTRSASVDTIEVLRDEQGDRAGGVFHCFTETAEVARAALDLGFFISFSGILTFRNADELRAVAEFVPLDRCLIETDSPYLAPMPLRGKVNTPANVPLVAARLAQVKGLSVERIAEATTANFRRLFLRTVPRSSSVS